MEIVTIVAIIIIVPLLFLSILGIYQVASAQTPFEVYNNPDYDIRIQYPDDWTVKHDNLPPHQVVRFSAPEIEEQKTSLHTIIYIPATIAVAVEQLDSMNVTTDQFIEQFFDFAYSSPSQFRIIETSNMTFAGTDARKIIMYEYVNNDNSKVMRVIGTQNGTAFSIKYTAEPGQFDEYLPIVQRMIDSFTINPTDTVSEPPSISVPPFIEVQNDTVDDVISADESAIFGQNQSEPLLLQPKISSESLIELPNRLIVTDDVKGDNRLAQKANVINGQLNEFPTAGATKGELYNYYPVVRFHFDELGKVGLVGVDHLLLGPIKSYESPGDILEDARYYTNIPLNEQIVLELDQPGLNYFIASVQFANNTVGIYSNIMDNTGFGTKSSAEDYLDYKMDQGNNYNILEDVDIEDIQSDPVFQQIASNIICSDLKEYGFQICEQAAVPAATPDPDQPAFQLPKSIFEAQDEDNNGDDDDDNDDNDDD